MTPAHLDLDLERFRTLVARRLGLEFDDTKLPVLGRALERRSEAIGLSADAYLDRLAAGASADELAELAGHLTVGETYFFRDANQFRALAEFVLPERARDRATGVPIRLLSLGCASGEEPYSLAIVLRETLPAWLGAAAIRAVDVNRNALARAAAGRFGPWALRGTPQTALERWFTPAARGFQLDPAIRAAVDFRQGNLADQDDDVWAADIYDVVFCRNVLMYLTPGCRQAVVQRILRALAPGGFLFLGHAETLRGVSDGFDLVNTHDTFYYRRRRADRPIPLPVAEERPARPEPAIDFDWFSAISRATERIAELSAQSDRAAPDTRAGTPAATLATTFELFRQERFAEAMHALHDTPDANPEAETLLLQAVLHLHQGDLAAAEAACRRLLDRDEMESGAHYVLALCLESAGQRVEACHQYRLAAHLDPTFAMPWLHLGMLTRRAGDPPGAGRALDRALSLLHQESAARIELFGNGFTRQALIALCRTERAACGKAPS